METWSSQFQKAKGTERTGDHGLTWMSIPDFATDT